MVGAIIGDIVGSRFEFRNTNRTDFELFTKDCGYTDDTICTIAVADALIHNDCFGASLHQWCRRFPCPMGGYGGRFGVWIDSPNPKPYGSYGNGSAMRVSPCGWLPTREQVLCCARCSAECTHNHPEGIKGALCLADCIFGARKGASKADIRDLVAEVYGYDLSRSCAEIRWNNHFDTTCQVTLPQAIRAFLEGESFEESVRLAVSLGGDSDTIAAMAGAVAEAYYGIPEAIAEEALSYLPAEMYHIVELFREKIEVRD